MKHILEEYGSTILAVLVGIVILMLLFWGLTSGGFLEVLARTFSQKTFGY